ncbi:hypothetical protein, partial [Lactobacillus delbrueckii]|uniref:hypothetical protein n=1 Tax=Lactobacillus delbrueckii TaxID=1584 RepID=UPI0022EBF4E2
TTFATFQSGSRFGKRRLKKKMLRTRIYPVTGFHIDVQESVEEVRKMLQYSEDGCFIAFTLENGEPTYIARDHVISFTKF